MATVYVVDVVAVGYGFVPAAVVVSVLAVFLGGHVCGELTLVPVILMCPVGVAFVQVVDVVVVSDGDVPAVVGMAMRMCLVQLVCDGHDPPSFDQPMY